MSLAKIGFLIFISRDSIKFSTSDIVLSFITAEDASL